MEGVAAAQDQRRDAHEPLRPSAGPAKEHAPACDREQQITDIEEGFAVFHTFLSGTALLKEDTAPFRSGFRQPFGVTPGMFPRRSVPCRE